jgi:hypothetical protein
LATLLPSVAAAAGILHDINRSALRLLVCPIAGAPQEAQPPTGLRLGARLESAALPPHLRYPR